jgi:hypothetical protein
VNLGDYHVIDSLDPFTSQQPWELRQDVLNLVYRGLMRFDPNNGALLPDLSRGTTDDWSIDRSGGVTQPAVVIWSGGVTSTTLVIGSDGLIGPAEPIGSDLMVPPGPIGSDDLSESAGPIRSDDLIGSAGPIGSDDSIESAGPIGRDDLIESEEAIVTAGPIGSVDPIVTAGPIGSVDPIVTAGPIGPVDPIGPGGPIKPTDPIEPTGPIFAEWGQIVRYQLRQDVRFHDGSALTAEDVVFSYKRAMESSTWSELLNGIRIRGIETPDTYTVVFTLSGKRGYILNPQIWTLPIVPAKVYQSDPNRFITNPVGCGPFIAQLIRGVGAKVAIVQLKAFEQYYLGTPRLQNLSIALQPDINVLIQRLVAGELNAIVLPENKKDAVLAGTLEQLEGKYQIIRTTRGIRSAVHVQDRSLRERLPNNYETNWNAHLWYI